MQVDTKIKACASIEEKSTAQIRKSAIQEFVELMHSKLIGEFKQILRDYYNKYRNHEKCLRRRKANCLKYSERWWCVNRNLSSTPRHNS